jgi:hypothetical protein
MSGKILIESKTPKTQSLECVESLAVFVNKKIDNGILDLGAVRLVRSSKGDCYYTVTANDCSCPARAYHPEKPCKHMKSFHAIPREMLIDAVIGEVTNDELQYWQDKEKGSLELMNTVGFKPVLAGE